MLLLQERVPRTGAFHPHAAEVAGAERRARASPRRRLRVFTHADTPRPAVQLLSNGRYHVMVTQRRRRLQPLARPGGHALARGRHARPLGQLLLPARRRQRRVLVDRAPADARARPTATRRSSPTRGPSSAAATTASTRTPRSRSRPRTTSSCAALRITNRAREPRTIELTSYAEVVLAPASPTRCTRPSATCSCRPSSCRAQQAILCTRRPRCARRDAAVDVAPDGGARRRHRRDLVRDRPRALHRPRQHACRARAR